MEIIIEPQKYNKTSTVQYRHYFTITGGSHWFY